MEKMDKKELIEFFVNELNKNNVLKGIFSEKEIKEKLHNIIKDVEYNNEDSTVYGTWNIKNYHIVFNLFKEFKKTTIIHELLHALTTSKDKNLGITKIGLDFRKHTNDKNYEVFGLGLNEGITDLLAEEISGIETTNYPKQKEFFKILSIIIGRDCILERYCKGFDEKEFTFNPYCLFNQVCKERYKETFGDEINISIVKAMSLLDHQTVLEQTLNR